MELTSIGLLGQYSKCKKKSENIPDLGKEAIKAYCFPYYLITMWL